MQRVTFEVTERTIASTEVVQRQANTQRGNLVQRAHHQLAVLHQKRLGDLQQQARGWQAGFTQHTGQQRGETGLLQLTNRQVDRAVQLALPRQLPAAHLTAGLVQHPLTNPDDLARLFQHRNELIGRHRLVVKAPAQQRFNADQIGLIACYTADRLIVQGEFAARQRLRQCALELQLARCLGMQAIAEQRELVLAGALGPVQRQISRLQRVQRLAIALQGRDADAGADRQRSLAELQRLTQLDQHPLRHTLGISFACQIAEQGDELIAAEACKVIAGAQAAQQALRHLDQHLVAGAMPETVVD